MVGVEFVERLPVGSDVLLAVLSPCRSVAWILLVVSNRRDPYHSWEYPKQKMDRKSLQIAPAATCAVEMMPLRVILRVFDRVSQFLPKRIPKIG